MTTRVHILFLANRTRLFQYIGQAFVHGRILLHAGITNRAMEKIDVTSLSTEATFLTVVIVFCFSILIVQNANLAEVLSKLDLTIKAIRAWLNE